MIRLLCALMVMGLVIAGGSAHAQESDGLIVSQIEWSSNDSQILIALQEGGLYVVDPAAQTILLALPATVTGGIADAVLQPGGDLIATVDGQYTLRLWDSRSGTLLRSVADNFYTLNVDWSANGQYLTTGNVNRLYVRDAFGDPLFQMSDAPEEVPDVMFNPSGEQLLLSFSVKLEVWDIASQQMLARNIAGGLRQSIQWSADENAFLAANIDNTREGTFYNIVVIDPFTGERLRTYSGFPNQLSSAYWSPDETQILTTSMDGTAYLVDAASGAITPIFSTDTPLLSADWSPYGGQVAIGAPITSAAGQTMREDNLNFADVPVQILVPDPSLERLQAIAALCGAPASLITALTSPLAQTSAAAVLNTTLDALPVDALPPGCAADLRAVAAAMAAS